MKNISQKRERGVYLLLIVFTVVIGLSSRKFGSFFPGFVATYGGDTLWALNVFLLIGLLFPSVSTLASAIIALGFSFLIEISQFYHPHWLDALRGTAIGGLILGFSFVWTDLICYTVGVVIGVILELLLVHRNSKLFSMS